MDERYDLCDTCSIRFACLTNRGRFPCLEVVSSEVLLKTKQGFPAAWRIVDEELEKRGRTDLMNKDMYYMLHKEK